MQPLLVGLTGGIACGKTTVSNLFQQNHHVPIIDADEIAHQLVEPHMPALQIIKNIFGKKIICDDGSLDRNQLRQIVFNNKAERDKLENILHPLIYQQIWQKVKQIEKPYCILSIPLLLETQPTYKVDKILVVDCPQAIQTQRLKARNNFTDSEIKAILNAQLSRQERLIHADDIINNDSNMKSLINSVDSMHSKYVILSHSKN